MYRTLRAIHRWVGLITSLFLMSLAITGFLLAKKGDIGWMRPAVVEATPAIDYTQVVGPGQAMASAFALGDARMKEPKDVDRVDYRPKDNIHKVLSKDGYLEVQVDGTTGKVLQTAPRNDQMTEDIHDLSIVSDFAHAWVLPAVAVILIFLSFSGIIMFFTPVYRRWKFKRSPAAANAKHL
ncbi:MAG: PepSY domain-containing protein [Fimbriimonadaceae bacterium]|nr:PepSY domain-containing protein [Fimbriimonadaceae bacterium]